MMTNKNRSRYHIRYRDQIFLLIFEHPYFLDAVGDEEKAGVNNSLQDGENP